MGKLPILALIVVGALGCASPSPSGPRNGAAAGPGPHFSASGPEADSLGANDGYPMGDPWTFYTLPFLVGSHSHLDEIFPAHTVRRAATPSRLERAAAKPTVRYQYEGETATVDDYLGRHLATGLLIARRDTILLERYQYGRNDRHRFTSWSMAKTVTSMLIGIAIAEGRIRSVDDRAEAYVPDLAGTEYGRTSLRDLLQMSSGVRFVEQYTGSDDVMQLSRDTFLQLGPGGVDAVKKYNERTVPSGTRFSYASVETEVLGLVLRNAIGRPVAQYLEEKLWQPIGAEADATWLIDGSGQEVTYCCLNAVLRDYARLGLLLAYDGNWRGRQLIPADWVRDATSKNPQRRHLWPQIATPQLGYGYQVWLLPGERRQFAFLGVRGQAILVDPQSRLVMVQTAVRRRPSGDPSARETRLLWEGVVTSLGS